MGCKNIDLCGYLDGELTPEESKNIKKHLEECPDCRRELANLRESRRLVRSLKPVQPPLGIASRITARISELEAMPQPAIPMKQLAIGLLAAVVVIMIGVGIIHYSQPPAVPLITAKGLITFIEGDVWVQSAEGTVLMSPYQDMVLTQGQLVRTAEGSIADLNFDVGSALRLKGNSELKLESLAIDKDTLARDFHFRLLSGTILTRIAKSPPGSLVAISTPQTLISVKGTSFIVALGPTQQTQAFVVEGSVEVTIPGDANLPVIVGEGEMVTVGTHPSTAPIKPIGQELAEINQIRIDKDFVAKIGADKKLYPTLFWKEVPTTPLLPIEKEVVPQKEKEPEARGGIPEPGKYRIEKYQWRELGE